jgi:hypothetical protein
MGVGIKIADTDAAHSDKIEMEDRFVRHHRLLGELE